jgi:hypothetical protein
LDENFIIALCIDEKEEDTANDYVTLHYLHAKFHNLFYVCIDEKRTWPMIMVTIGCLDEIFIISLCINEKRGHVNE